MVTIAGFKKIAQNAFLLCVRIILRYASMRAASKSLVSFNPYIGVLNPENENS